MTDQSFTKDILEGFRQFQTLALYGHVLDSDVSIEFEVIFARIFAKPTGPSAVDDRVAAASGFVHQVERATPGELAHLGIVIVDCIHYQVCGLDVNKLIGEDPHFGQSI